MEKTRRNLLKAAAGGSVAAGLGMMITPKAAEPAMAQQFHQGGHPPRGPLSGPLVSATVSFGQWRTDHTPPLDRVTNPLPPVTSNHHTLTPFESTIQAGGAVNFIIAGLHNVQVFDHGTRPEHIDTRLLIPMQQPPGLPLINDSRRRIYRGPDPSLVPLDRAEVVTFARPGTYLVICGFLFHFEEGMYGYIRVLP